MTARRPTAVAQPVTSRGESFLAGLHERIPGGWEDPQPKDARFEELARDVDAMSSPSKLALLEAAATTVRPGEIYLEVGALFGVSTIAAGRATSDLQLTVVDDFSQFGGSPERLTENLRRYGLDQQTDLIIDDYRAALDRAFPPIGVYFFDGPHTYVDQYIGLELALPHLADEALVIVDDTRWRHVRRANLDFVAAHPALSLLCDLPSPSLNHRTWWNGLQVFEYRTALGTGGRDFRFQMNRLRYGITQPMKVYQLYYPHIAPRITTLRKIATALVRRGTRIARGG